MPDSNYQLSVDFILPVGGDDDNKLSLLNASFFVLCVVVIQFLFSIWIKSRLENSIKSEYDRFLEDYKFDLKAREQAAKVAEYIAFYNENSDNFARMNQLSFELALWLPGEIYKSLGKAIKKEDSEKNIFQVLIDLRKTILRNIGDLTDKNIIWHAEMRWQKIERIMKPNKRMNTSLKTSVYGTCYNP